MMESRWFNTAVVLIWMCTTTWLVVAKVLPPLRRGQPPNYRSMYARSSEDKKEETVGWDLTLSGKPLGWAVSRLKTPEVTSASGKMTEVSSRIHFDRVPLAELSPSWMRIMLRTTADPIDDLQMDVFSTLTIDTLGHLEGFQSRLNVAGARDAISIVGRVHATLLKIEVKSGDFVYPFETYLPSDALVSDELSPQSRLLGLRLGQEWTVPVFSALRPPNNPVDILQAKVESHELLMWEGEAVPVFQVVYRPDSGSALSSTVQSRAKLWVREDGMVLKQEVSVIGSPLVFSRMSEERSTEKAAESLEEEQRQRMFFRRRRNPQFGPPSGQNSPAAQSSSNPVNNQSGEPSSAGTATLPAKEGATP
jgi:hypothetical protein